MTSDELSDRLWRFAARVGNLVDALPDTRVGRHIAGQLVRCGTSAPPNYDEACAAESRADFIHKIGVALKEMKETLGWLHFIVISRVLPESRVAQLQQEAHELANILARSILTAKARRCARDNPPR
jgi:four helix bundle protein